MEQKTKLLLAEDDENLGLLLKEYLVAKGYDANLFPDGETAYKGFLKDHYDACILDIMMPKKDGFTLAKDIRVINPDIPIIFLTAKNLKEDVLEGFKLGADDYMTKPFSMEELILRIEAILRRTSQESQLGSQQVFTLGQYIFDTHKQTLTYGDSTVKLTTKEADLLKLLCQNANKVLERNYALKLIWIDDNYFNARSMDVYITRLRKHLNKEPSIEIINVHGKGYKLII
ncbi:MAG: response regulator transcription factor [Bacteroidales bacterium]|jgi:DNA-binding response OmpR family regulator|nr:response regulator transcription factor [Bacteroidales bacterium]